MIKKNRILGHRIRTLKLQNQVQNQEQIKCPAFKFPEPTQIIFTPKQIQHHNQAQKQNETQIQGQSFIRKQNREQNRKLRRKRIRKQKQWQILIYLIRYFMSESSSFLNGDERQDRDKSKYEQKSKTRII